MPKTLIVDTPGAFATKEELESFIEEMKQKPDADEQPLKREIERAEERLQDIEENGNDTS